MILGISGKINSGKDTVGKIIQALVINSQDQYKDYFKVPLEKPGSDSASPMSTIIDFINGNINIPGAMESASGWQIRKFATKIKQIVSLLTGCSVQALEDPDFKDSHLPKEWNYCYFDGEIMSVEEGKQSLAGDDIQWEDKYIQQYTYRKFLQHLGTNAMRDVMHKNIWVNALFADYVYQNLGNDPPLGAPSKWIITDLRYPNELKAIKDRGGITIRVERPSLKPGGITSLHPSETSLDGAEFDYTLHNSGTIEELIEKVKAVLIAEKIL